MLMALLNASGEILKAADSVGQEISTNPLWTLERFFSRLSGAQIWEGCETFLSLMGLLSFGMMIFRFIWSFRRKTEWIDNIRFEEYPLEEDLNTKYPYFIHYYPDDPDDMDESMEISEGATKNLVIPQNTIFRNMVLYKLKKDDSGEIADPPYEKICEFKNITPLSPICLVIERTHAEPTYMIEWEGDYGIRARYFFGCDMYDEQHNFTGYRYEMGMWQRIRIALDIK